MTTTPEQKKELLTEAWKLVGSATRSLVLSEDDYADLRASCIDAANRAIDSWEPDRGRTLSSWIFRHVVQAKRDYLRDLFPDTTHDRQATFERDASCFSELQNGEEDRGECPAGCKPNQSAHHRAMVQDMEIIIDRARNDEVLSEMEYRMLVLRRQGGTYRSIGAECNYSPAGVKGVLDAAVAKIRLAYRTAE